MIWITGYAGSGKSYISKNIKNAYEFDEIENLMIKESYNLKGLNSKTFKPLCKDFLKKTNIKILNGVQAYDYYEKEIKYTL